MYIPTDPSPTPLQSHTLPVESSGIYTLYYIHDMYIATARAVDETDGSMKLGILQKYKLYH